MMPTSRTKPPSQCAICQQKREYTYQRTTPVKGPDGRETHQTMRLRTAHDETHMM